MSPEILECVGGPWDGEMATVIKADSYRGFASGRYAVAMRYCEATHPWGEKFLKWSPA